MTDSLREQLLKAGFKPGAQPAPQVREAAGPKAGPRRPAPAAGRSPAPAAAAGVRSGPGKPPRKGEGEIDLARAYALRREQEQREQAAAARLAAEKARLRKEQRERARALLEGKALNRPDAELLRHFEYGGKIRRVHVDEAQLRALNAGELGVVQFDGCYLLVARADAEAVRTVAPQFVALLPDAGAADDDADAAAG